MGQIKNIKLHIVTDIKKLYRVRRMEALFIGEVDEVYKCIVCHLVLKDPVLIVDCGHRLCKHCFESLRSYATQHNNPLLCPHDRKKIDADKVVDDRGVARTVMNLQVHCNNNQD